MKIGPADPEIALLNLKKKKQKVKCIARSASGLNQLMCVECYIVVHQCRFLRDSVDAGVFGRCTSLCGMNVQQAPLGCESGVLTAS